MKSFDDAPAPSQVATSPPRDPGDVRLLALLEQASAGSRELDAHVARHIGFTQEARGKERNAWWRDAKGDRCGFDWFTNHPPQFTTSLDAALKLLGPDYFWRVGHDGEGQNPADFLAIVMHEAVQPQHGRHASAPLALCIAYFSARATQDGGR